MTFDGWCDQNHVRIKESHHVDIANPVESGIGRPSVSQARANGAWCAEAGGRNSYSNCGYHTFAQCLAAISGVGGLCSPNPKAVAYESPYRVQRIYR